MFKYSPFLVSDPRDKVINFVTRVSDDLQVECHSDMLHNNMNISCIMVHALQVKSQGLRERVEMLRGEDLFMVVLQGVGLIS